MYATLHHIGPRRLSLWYFEFIHTNSDAAQLEKSVCMGTMLWSKAAYWESPVLASLSCCAAWESWKAASGCAESGSMVHSLSSRSATPFRSSQKPKAKAALRRRFSSCQNQNEKITFHFWEKNKHSFKNYSLEPLQLILPYRRSEFYLAISWRSSGSSGHQSVQWQHKKTSQWIKRPLKCFDQWNVFIFVLVITAWKPEIQYLN